MDSKTLGAAIIAIGAVLTVYEWYFSYCSALISDLCYFPVSPSEPFVTVPWYSIAILIFGLLVYLGSSAEKQKTEESE